MTSDIEVWRGTVNAWDCDQMGHMNVRFYVERAMQGLGVIALRLGMPDAFRPEAQATLRVRSHHVRFLREARTGAALHMTAGVVDVTETEATLALRLWHSRTNQVAAGFTASVAHVTTAEDRPFAWPERMRRALDALRVEAPAECGPRGLSVEAPSEPRGTRERAEALGLPIVGQGVFTAADCDAHGRLRPDAVMGKASDAAPHLFAAWRRYLESGNDPRDLGRAMMEGRLLYGTPPRVGDLYEIRSGIASVDDRFEKRVDWFLDPVSGRAIAALEALVATFDMDARKMVILDEAVRADFRSEVVEGLAL